MKISKIQKDVPVPEVHSKIDYPWPRMEVGDSVLIQPEKDQSLKDLQRIVGPAARYYAEKTGKVFKTMFDYDGNGIRIWRMK